jgi:AcrR family transcriptional regulator
MSDTAARPRTATLARGEDTRGRLIEAAIEAFGAYGYDATSTRRLAEQAGTTLPSIQYYFGGKEGLYRAAVEHIAQSMNEHMAPVAERVYAALGGRKLRRSDLLALLGEMLDAFVLMMVGAEDRDSRKRFLTRAELEGSAVLDTFRDSILRNVAQPSAALIGRLLDRPPKDEAVMLRTIAIVGQVSVFCHLGARRALGWDKFTDERVRAVQKLVRQHAEAILDRAVRTKIGKKT